MSTKSAKSVSVALKVLVVLVAVAVMAAAGFYQDEVKSYFQLQGWNLSPVKDATRQFIRAAAEGDGDRVAGMIAEDAQILGVERAGGKVTGLTIPDYGGPRSVRLKSLAPAADAEIGSPTIIALNGGSVAVRVTFPQAHGLQMSWVRSAGGWRVKEIGWVSTP